VSLMEKVTRCDSCAIRHRAVCEALDRSELMALNRISSRKLVQKGQTILSEGGERSLFANIVSGVVKLTKSLDDGRQHIVGLLFAPDFLGRAYRPDNPYFAEAATEVELCVFSAAGFERIMQAHPSLEQRLLQLTLSELDASHEWMLLLARKTAAEKVASFLLMLAKRAPNIGCSHSANEPSIRIDLPLSRAEIADCLGLTIETVSRQMTKLKTAKIIELLNYREIAVPDLTRLQQAAHCSTS
jgi:CRP/FNR family transcriptional regulator, anaerobic regulatory protein